MTWVCKNCKTNNDDYDEYCFVCGEPSGLPLPTPEPEPEPKPIPQPAPAPQPTPQPAPKAQSKPTPKPQPQPSPKPTPKQKPKKQPKPPKAKVYVRGKNVQNREIPVALIVITLVVTAAILALNIVLGGVHYSWSSWVFYAECVFFAAFYAASMVLLNKVDARHFYSFANVVILFVNALTLTLCGEDVLTLFISFAALGILVSIFQYANSVIKGDRVISRHSKHAALALQVFFAAFTIVLSVVGGDLSHAAQETLTLLALIILATSAIYAATASGKCVRIGNALFAAHFTLVAMTIPTVFCYLAFEYSAIVITGLMAFFTLSALILLFNERKTSAYLSKVIPKPPLFVHVFFAISTLAFAIVANVASGSDVARQITIGAVLASSAAYFILSVEHLIQIKRREARFFNAISALALFLVNSLLLFLFRADYYLIGTVLYLLLVVLGARTVKANANGGKFRLPALLLVIVSFAFTAVAFLLSDTFSSPRNSGFDMLLSLAMGLALFLTATHVDSFTRSRGYVGTFAAIAVIIFTVIKTTVTLGDYAPAAVALDIPTVIGLMISAHFHKMAGRRKMKNLSLLLLLPIVLFAVIVLCVCI